MKNKSKLSEFSMLNPLASSGSEFPGHLTVLNFEDEDLVKFKEEFFTAESDPVVQDIVVWISSYGGNCHNALAMVDIIKSSNKKTFTVALGKAMSAGALLLAAGDKGNRFVSPNSYIMIHEAHGGTAGKTQDVIQQTMELSHINERILHLLSSFTGKTHKQLKDFFKNRMNTDIIFTPQEAVRFGIVDKIAVPRPISFPQQSGVGIYKPLEVLKKASKKSSKKA
jgi:ATP-dependent Clp protease, protease subunit